MDNPAEFSKFNSNTVQHAQYLLEKYHNLFEWNGFEDMLDIGCGNGRITNNVLHPFVEQHLNRLEGSDLSQEAVDVGNKIHTKPNLSFLQMDIADPKVGDQHYGKYGHIFAFYCFQLVRPSEAWAQNIYKMLKPNGEIFATLNLAPNGYTKIIDDQKADKTSPWIKYVESTPDLFVNYGPDPIETVSKIVEDAGLTIKKIDIESLDVTYADIETMRGVNASVNPVFKNIPKELRESYLADYLERCEAISMKDENGCYKSKMRALVFLAKKKL